MDGSTLALIVSILGVLALAAAGAGVVYLRSRPPDVRRLRARRDERALVRALQYQDPEVRRAAAEGLGPLASTQALEALATALRDPDERVAVAVAAALGQAAERLRDGPVVRRATTPLVAALQGNRTPVCVAAAVALAQAGPVALEPLMSALDDPRVDVSMAAAGALGRMGDARAVPTLVAALQDARADVCATAVAALANIGAPAVEPLLPVLRSGPATVRRHAAVVLGQIGDGRSVPDLVAALHDEHWDVRRAAADALRRCGAPAVTPLIAVLEQDDAERRAAAAAALVEIGAPAIEPLYALVRDRRLARSTRQTAAEVLDRSSAALTPAQDAWCAVVRSDWARAAALGPAAAEPLAEALRDRDALVRRAAALAFDAAGVPPDPTTQAWHAVGKGDWERATWLEAPALEPLFAVLTDTDQDVRFGAVSALGRIGAGLEDVTLRAQVVQALLNALEDRAAPVSQAAAEALGRVGSHSVEPLIAILNDRTADASVREAAAAALGRTGQEHAVGPLLSAVRGDRWRVRIAAAEALGEIGTPAVTSLLAALTDDRWYLRWAGARALGLARYEGAAGALRSVLKDDEKFVRWSAAEALEQFGPPPDPATEAWHAVTRRDWARAVGLGTASVAPLVTSLRDPDQEARAAAAAALIRIGRPAVGPLVKALGDRAPHVRASAATALGPTGAREAVEPLLHALSDPEAEVRRAAARALGQIGDARAVDVLIAALTDQDLTVRPAAAEALGAIGEPAVGPLFAVLMNASADARWLIAAALGQTGDARAVDALMLALQDERATVRRSAVEALGALRDPRLAEPLLAALGDRDATVRAAAAQALVPVGKTAAGPLIEALRDEHPPVRSAAADALGEICAQTRDTELRAQAAAPLGAALLHDEEAPVRRAAAQALGKVGVPAVELLAASLEDHDRDVRRAATEALDKVGLPSDPATHARYAVTRRDWASASALGSVAVEAVLAAVDEEEIFMRQAAAQALAEIGTAAVEPLIAALAGGSAVAADALGQIGDGRAVEPLLAALRGSPGLRVRQAAEGALARLLRQGHLDETARQRILAARS